MQNTKKTLLTIALFLLIPVVAFAAISGDSPKTYGLPMLITNAGQGPGGKMARLLTTQTKTFKLNTDFFYVSEPQKADLEARDYSSLWVVIGSTDKGLGASGITIDQEIARLEKMVGWAKENARSSGLEDAPIRWLVDDCQKFVEREIRRGNHYDAIIMDPPSYGRGPKGEIWKIEDAIHPLIKLCTQILSDDPLFFLVNSYTTGLAPAVLTYMLGTELKKWNGHVDSQEIGLPVTHSGLVLPCGASGRWEAV